MPPTLQTPPSPAPPAVKSLLALGAFLAVCFGAAAFGAQFRPGAWYAALQKPSWNPPNWIFGPVWTALYAAMAVSGWLVWRRGGFAANAPHLGVYFGQLALNALWSWIFFGLRNPGLAFGEVVVVWMAIGATVGMFRAAHRAAAWLLVPYLAWVTFASALNFAIWRLNPSG